MRPIDTSRLDSSILQAALAETRPRLAPAGKSKAAAAMNDGASMGEVAPQEEADAAADDAVGLEDEAPQPVASAAPGEKTTGKRKRESGDGDAPPPRRQTESPTAGQLVGELEALLVAHYDPKTRWDSRKSEKAALEIADQLTGFSGAAGALVAIVGAYCAWCECAEPTGLRADPLKPVQFFPKEAFDPANLLLACATCRERKNACLGRAQGQLISLCTNSGGGAQAGFAWPHLYWRNPRAGTIRNRLYEFPDGPDGSGGIVPSSSRREAELLRAYRLGLLRPRLAGSREMHALGPAGPASSSSAAADGVGHAFVTVRIESDGGDLQRTIALLDLNNEEKVDDRRPVLRTECYFRALDFRESLGAAAERKDQLEGLTAMRDAAIASSGFWSVWRDVFAEAEPAFVDRLKTLFPGTALPTQQGA